jgi:Glycosyl hydrolase family 57
MSAGQLRLFSVCHLNLSYSSIEEEQRIEVLERCYWPLLRLARRHGVPLGIEASVYTLECIRELDPQWLSEFRALCDEGTCELIGSGYVQLIGPLVPPEVNAANLRLGNSGYEDLLGARPQVALINEQAYSAGLLQHYVEAGFRAIVMEWDNPARWHPEWNPEWRYYPQIACGQHSGEIPLIWNKSIAFQKFQRLAHGEMDYAEYLQYLEAHISETPRAFPLYGNDVEVFDFRPGRFHTEPKLEERGEWNRISDLLDILIKAEKYQFVLPSQILELMDQPGAGNRLHLESAEDPAPVKKQEKYNITRWAVTGRNDLGINTACHRLYRALKDRSVQDEAAWRELCYLWSSDFRTHITEKRWRAYLERLAAAEERFKTVKAGKAVSTSTKSQPPSAFGIQREGRFLKLENDNVRVVLNCRRGLAIDSLLIKAISSQSLMGTLPHGYFQDIALGADYYSGHLILETPGQPKITDLSAVEPEIFTDDDGQSALVEGVVETPLGPVHKRVRVNPEGDLTFSYRLDWDEMPPGALRVAHVTLNPEAFDPRQLYFESHNGGFQAERFPVGAKRIEHGRSVSFLVSATGAMGMTNGQLRLGDHARHIQVQTRMDQAAVVAQITFLPVAGSFFYRASFSAAELDETCRNRQRVDFPRSLAFTVAASQSAKPHLQELSAAIESSVPK